MLAAEAKAAHGTFHDWVGGLDENFELTVLLTPFIFWQKFLLTKSSFAKARWNDLREKSRMTLPVTTQPSRYCAINRSKAEIDVVRFVRPYMEMGS